MEVLLQGSLLTGTVGVTILSLVGTSATIRGQVGTGAGVVAVADLDADGEWPLRAQTAFIKE